MSNGKNNYNTIKTLLLCELKIIKIAKIVLFFIRNCSINNFMLT